MGWTVFLSPLPDNPQLTGYTAIRKTNNNIKGEYFFRDRHLSFNL